MVRERFMDWPLKPTPTTHSEPFWNALAEGQLMICHCRSCGHRFLYPKGRCPACMSAKIDWVEASGYGTIWSHTRIERGLGAIFDVHVPYTLVVAQTIEGPTMMGLWCEATAVAEIGAPVTVCNAGTREEPLVGFVAGGDAKEPNNAT